MAVAPAAAAQRDVAHAPLAPRVEAVGLVDQVGDGGALLYALLLAGALFLFSSSLISRVPSSFFLLFFSYLVLGAL